MVCANCGKQNDEGTKFCIECGANLAEQRQVTTDSAQSPTQESPANPSGTGPTATGSIATGSTTTGSAATGSTPTETTAPESSIDPSATASKAEQQSPNEPDSKPQPYVERQSGTTNAEVQQDEFATQARMEDFEITQDAPSTASLPPISHPDAAQTPSVPSFAPATRDDQGNGPVSQADNNNLSSTSQTTETSVMPVTAAAVQADGRQSNLQTDAAGGPAPASAYYPGNRVPGQGSAYGTQPNVQGSYPNTPTPYASTPYAPNPLASTPLAPTPNVTQPMPNGAAKKGGRTPFIIIASIAGAALLLCLAAFITYSMGLWGTQASTSSGTPSASGSETPSSTSPSSSTSQSVAGFDAKGLNAIVDGVSTTDVSVAATVDGNASSATGENTYTSQQADKQFVAAGLYLPIYLQARSQNNATALTSATAMMQNMDNSAGNDAISALGGLDAVSQWSAQQGYAQTSFARNLGDVQASAAGYENRSSASDASRMLSAAQSEGATEMMNFDLASDGVSVPSGVSVHAHRGMGIQNTYNYFITMSKGSKSISVAVMTQSQGKERTAQMTSELLSSMATSFGME